MESNDVNDMIEIIQKLNEKYIQNKNTYSQQRLKYHISNLSNIIENENKKNDDRLNKHNELVNEQEIFSNLFLSQNKFFYMQYSGKFYEYDGKKYYIISEDMIYHKLLSEITNEQKLVQWKHKTKLNIIKKIKNLSLLKSIPELFTIENIISFLQIICFSNEESIYLLCLLGDCILKKNYELLYFIKPNTKNFINFIDNIIYNTCGYSIFNNFIVKYHESHEISKYRLIKTKSVSSIELLKNSINDIGLELICVSTYYSEFYGNSENYLNTLDDDIKNYVLLFSNKSSEEIIDNFIEEYIDFLPVKNNDELLIINSNVNNINNINNVNNDNSSTCNQNVSNNVTIVNNINNNIHDINWKNFHYIWKIYLHNKKIPTFLYTNVLQKIFLLKINNTCLNGEIYFNNITSKYLPNISSFISFWNENIIYTNTDTELISNIDNNELNINNFNFNYDYEIAEILQLYKNSNYKCGNLNSKNVSRIINHYFYSNVIIIDDKYLKGIKCKLWNKNDEIKKFLDNYKYNLIKNDNLNDFISINKIYNEYKKNCINKNLIISNDYFQEYILLYLCNYITHDNLIDIKWLCN